MRKPTDGSPTGQSLLAVSDRDAFRELPGLRDFFLSTKYDDAETEREPGMLIVRAEATRWVWTLKDPSAASQLLVAAPTWDEVQTLAELLLCDDKAPWVPDMWARKKRRGGR